ncbi:MAG: YihY/virulence factor BrkB family protein [Bacteroidetes bacterium]|jgi:membrane protein|nr:YihY/virulence factor BrkB family protein [Bacteroidota bacterium]
MRRLISVLLRVPRTCLRYAKGLFVELQEKEIFLLAQAIAFKVLVTIVPILILVTAGVAQVLTQEEPFDRVASFLREFLPAYQSDQLILFMRQLQGAGDALLGIGVLGLFISAITLMTTLRLVIMFIFDQDWHSRRSLLGGYLMDARMVLQTGVFFVLSVGLTVLVSNLDGIGMEVLRTLGLEFDLLRIGWRRTIWLIGLLLPLLLSTVMFAQLYYFLPIPRPAVTGVTIGALIAGILWEIAKAGFTVYASYVGQFDRYTEGGGLGSLGEAFGLILFFVFWVYYSGVVFIIGALIALEYEKQHHTAEKDAPSGHIADEHAADDSASGKLPSHHGAGAEGEAQQPKRSDPKAHPGGSETAPQPTDGASPPPGNGLGVSSSEPLDGSSSSAPPHSA